MTRTAKTTLVILGILTAVCILGQLVLGLLLSRGATSIPNLAKMHQHSGYTTVAVTLSYVVVSLILALKAPTQRAA